jgi:hypothetical protein
LVLYFTDVIDGCGDTEPSAERLTPNYIEFLVPVVRVRFTMLIWTYFILMRQMMIWMRWRYHNQIYRERDAETLISSWWCMQ